MFGRGVPTSMWAPPNSLPASTSSTKRRVVAPSGSSAIDSRKPKCPRSACATLASAAASAQVTSTWSDRLPPGPPRLCGMRSHVSPVWRRRRKMSNGNSRLSSRSAAPSAISAAKAGRLARICSRVGRAPERWAGAAVDSSLRVKVKVKVKVEVEVIESGAVGRAEFSHCPLQMACQGLNAVQRRSALHSTSGWLRHMHCCSIRRSDTVEFSATRGAKPPESG